MPESVDVETKNLLSEQDRIKDLVSHEAWPLLRKRLTDKILELQNAFSIDASDANKMLVDLTARKIATETLFNFLREVEGTAQQSVENTQPTRPSYILVDE